MRWFILLGLCLLHLAGVGLFFLGFFPSKIVLQGFNEYNEIESGKFDPIYNKVVIMVVDALRSDFMFSDQSEMSFTQELIRRGAALGFTAFSNPPTVTLPRLKGITTGSTPNFLDAVMNVVEEDSSNNLAKQDSWIQQLLLNNKKIHMFGDDTWLKLFPDMFNVTDGTASFFVSDFTEVDNNVTRHLDNELNNQNWDCLILHYLGLDHIGHKGGPKSIFMKPKQKEMDNIVEKIYNKLNDDTLFIVLGDHGMNEIGNHGGSSKGETSAALIFISNKFKKFNKGNQAPIPYNDDFEYYNKIQQIDLVPTISSLLHLPIPINSLGIFIKDFLPLWNKKQQNNVILDNFNHFKKFINGLTPSESIELIYDQLREIQSELTQNATNYDIPKILIGIGINFIVILINLLISAKNTPNWHTILISISIPLTLGFSSFGSSLVEEEHQIWWWLVMLVAFIGFVKYQDIEIVKILACLRVLRNWNNMGTKFINEISIDSILNSYPFWKWILIVLTIYQAAIQFRSNQTLIIKLFNSLTFLTILVFKVLFCEIDGQFLPWDFRFSNYLNDPVNFNILLSYSFFWLISLTIIFRLILSKTLIHRQNVIKDINDLIRLVLIYQASINNIPIFLVLRILRDSSIIIFQRYKTDNPFINIGFSQNIIIILQNAIFFKFGQTNTLPTIDLSNSYNGVSEYNMIPIGILTFLNNFGGVVYCFLLSFEINFNDLNKLNSNELKFKVLLNLNYYSILSFFYLVSCYLQRYHLFIWTVFSPKILYLIAWILFMNLIEFLTVGCYLILGI